MVHCGSRPAADQPIRRRCSTALFNRGRAAFERCGGHLWRSARMSRQNPSGTTARPSQGKGGTAMNPFEDPDASYLVLINDEGQHSLWPIFIDVPAGWTAIFGEAGRQECLDFIEKNWTDMRPKSLIEAMEK
jgi:MbtH protein